MRGYRLTSVDGGVCAIEAAVGAPLGIDAGAADLLYPSLGDTPRVALEGSLREALLSPSCLIMFSGGRDSSALLALAADVAKREDLDPPIAYTARFPGIEPTDEAEWQEQVMRHIGDIEWVREDLSGRLGWVGSVAGQVLRHDGLLWPPNSHFMVPVLERARGGSIISGVFGDEMLSQEPRMARVRNVLAGRSRPRMSDVPRIIYAMSPRRVREVAVRIKGLDRRSIPDWVKPAARDEIADQLRTDIASPTLRWDKDFDAWLSSRSFQAIRHAAETLGNRYNVDVRYPFGDPGFVSAFVREGGKWGFPSRTAAMEHLFGELLPRAVITRRSKANFHAVGWDEETREFIESWDGRGLREDLVDVDVLRAHWRINAASDRPATEYAFQSALPLQAAWLASQGIDTPLSG